MTGPEIVLGEFIPFYFGVRMPMLYVMQQGGNFVRQPSLPGDIVYKERLKQERAKLTEARALLLYVLYDLVRNGEYVSEFSSEKVCYFLQRFGAEKYFRLEFEPNFYGPYSGRVKFVLNALSGSYIMGYSDMNKKPFEPLTLVADGYETVTKFIETNPALLAIGKKAINFLNGFYSDFGLELLSSLDYIIVKDGLKDKEEITRKLESWSDRKRSLFSNPRYIDLSLEHLHQGLPSDN